MEELNVQASSHAYSILIGEGIRNQITDYFTNSYSSIWIITDENVAKLYLGDVLETLSDFHVHHTILPAGEQTKSIDYYNQLMTEAIAYGLDRYSLLIALGGGVIGDLVGFVAATYMRGIDYIQMPTTILAHDSSVGGKVAINHPLGKNLIGSFYAPQGVFYDMETLITLNDREIRSGYAELVKEALISDEAIFRSILTTKLQNLSTSIMQEHIRSGIQIKAQVVEQDEKENAMRKYLNLGHTLGHALEAHLGYGSITHGEAVAIGLLFALHVSESVFDTTLPFLQLKQWLETNHYPLHFLTGDQQTILAKMKNDKKNKQHHIQMVLLEQVGKPFIKQMTDEDMLSYLSSFTRKLVNN
ncbi:3-dehydroquinate synthase [Virgibacillus dokdonensis]|uniref:3-dehydroquinate synthase n=1 Tax=Virgibacillus dokdonensis TaxID=302167 RepID=A0A3E0WZ26_9BACI|nr:3-dehydroquinate synthase [Virgibacillus dokdonensis]RFA37245.1 3-dehydroquinate synthase [Virgibacillus dokdonensis]